MKSFVLSIAVCVLSIMTFGCQTTTDVMKSEIHELRKPTGPCEIVGPKYAFKFENGYDIVSLQPIVQNDRIVILLGDSAGRTAAFLMRVVGSNGNSAKKGYSEKITLSSPEKVLKLEGYDSGKDRVKYRGKSYKAYVSYERQEWQPLTGNKLKSPELAHDISLMKKSLEGALRLDYVVGCLDFDKKEAQSVGTVRSMSTNCFVDNELCLATWESWGDQNGSSRDEFNAPPFQGDWYPENIGDNTLGGGGDLNVPRSNGDRSPPEPEGCRNSMAIEGRGPTKSHAESRAKRNAGIACNYVYTCSECCNYCMTSSEYIASLSITCYARSPFQNLP